MELYRPRFGGGGTLDYKALLLSLRGSTTNNPIVYDDDLHKMARLSFFFVDFVPFFSSFQLNCCTYPFSVFFFNLLLLFKSQKNTPGP